jgi:hypothetical protein
MGTFLTRTKGDIIKEVQQFFWRRFWRRLSGGGFLEEERV